jgi:aspartyl-tRNA(Asn)/glutamyl-tRNA(Gln) amidotransferase subunit A
MGSSTKSAFAGSTVRAHGVGSTGVQASSPMEKLRLSSLSIVELAPLLSKREISPSELANDVLSRIEELNPLLNAYVHIDPAMICRDAQVAEKEILRGRYKGPLHGIPISSKDNILTAGIPTTAGSRILGDYVPAEDAFIVRRLRKAGAILIGKTNLSEFAYGTETNNPRFGRTRNPWDTRRIPGGSSGGGAAATAAFMCPASIGTDTGGSIRSPSALCGIVGLKPTFGRVSCQGVIALAPSLDHMGTLTRSAMDAAIVLNAIAGHDPQDELSVRHPVHDYRSQAGQELTGLRVGLPREFFFDDLDEEIEAAVRAASVTLQQLGVRLEEVSLPHLPNSEIASTQLTYAEATSFHQSAGYFPARAADYAPDVCGRLEEGAHILATDYIRAMAVRRLMRMDFHQALTQVDAILAPTVMTPAPMIDQQTVTINSREISARLALIRLTRPSNLTGLPAITIPCGLTREGLPIGLQLIGRPFEEGTVLQLAHGFEAATAWHRQHPPILLR